MHRSRALYFDSFGKCILVIHNPVNTEHLLPESILSKTKLIITIWSQIGLQVVAIQLDTLLENILNCITLTL